MFWSAVIPGVLLLGLVIFVHELGHFLAAKWRRVTVHRFSLGFGPAIVKFQRGETEYRLGWIPLGGYVQMAGDSVGEDGEMPADAHAFLSHPWPGRFLIAVAGPAANLVTAFAVFVIVALTGVSSPDWPNVVGPTPDSSLAFQAGLREGDRFVALNGKPITTWRRLSDAYDAVPAGQAVTIDFQRGDSAFAMTLAPERRAPVWASLRLPSDAPVIGNVITGMPAYKAGLKEGDRVVTVDGAPIAIWGELPPAFAGKANREVVVGVEREGRRLDIRVTPIDPTGGPEGTQGRIGIEPPVQGVFVQRYGPIEAVQLGIGATGAAIVNVYGGMWMTFTRPLYYREYLGGPIFIAQAASEQARRGLDAYLQFLAMINIAVMAFNLLPIPVLDGGHIVLALLEAVRRRAISAVGYLRYQKVGLVVVGTLLLLILANDPMRLLQRQRALDRTHQETQVAPSPH